MRVVAFSKESIPKDYPSDFKRTQYYEDPGLFIGEYYGEDLELLDYKGEDLELLDYKGESPVIEYEYRTRLRPGEVIALLKDPSNPMKGSYAKIYRAAYPVGSAVGDDMALEFLEQAKNTYSEDGMIDVRELVPALDYFLASPQNYIDESDRARVLGGFPTRKE